MRILLDECIPVQVRRLFAEHDCSTAKELGWEAITNGALLTLAQEEFDVFITADQNMRYQQNLSGYRIAIVELSSNNLRRIKAAGDIVPAAVLGITDGEYRRVPIP